MCSSDLTGKYVYDPHDHHGPTLYYLALIPIEASGVRTMADIETWMLRIVPVAFSIATLLLLIPLCSPQGWDYGLLVSTPAVMLILTRHSRLGRPWQVASGVALVVMGFSLFDVMGRPAYASFMALSIISVCALALVATLVRLRVAGEA